MSKKNSRDVSNYRQIIKSSILEGEFNENVVPVGNRYNCSDFGIVAYSIDREYLSRVKIPCKELTYNSIYFLIGNDRTTLDECIYVGQAKERNGKDGGVLFRLREHDKAVYERYYDKWKKAVVVTSKEEAWGPTELNALENIFYHEIPADIRQNGNEPNKGIKIELPKYTQKIEQIEIYLAALGVNAFIEKEEIQKKVEENFQFLDEAVENLNPTSRIPEIVTPKKVVDKLIESLPDSVWNKNTVFLDPACKGGEILKALYDKLLNSEDLKAAFPDEDERKIHILKNQLFGIALSKFSYDRTKKSLKGFDNNIVVIDGYIDKLKSNLSDGLTLQGKKVTFREYLGHQFGRDNMRFDVVISNPPYQEYTDKSCTSGRALYNFFIDAALEIARVTDIIVPSRWMSDKPNGLEEKWLLGMREREDYLHVDDYINSEECFKGVSIAGGVCVLVLDRDYKGDAKIVYHGEDGIQERVGKLSYNGVVIRNQRLVSIVQKVNATLEDSIYSIIGTNRQFSPTDDYFATNWTGFRTKKTDKDYIRYFANSRVLQGEAYVSESELPLKAVELAKKFKMFLILSGPTNNLVVNAPFIGGTNSCCSRTYAPMFGAAIDNEEKAENCIKYWKTKFFRVLVSAIKTTQHATRIVYKFVPLQDFTSSSDIDWTQSIQDIDKQLYKKYNLSQEEIDYIERTIKPMS